MKKILVFIITLFFTFFIIFLSIKMSKKAKNMLSLLNNQNELIFLSDKIQDKIKYRDKLIDLKIDDVLVIKKKVKVYQWVETKKLLNKMGSYIYDYEKKWSDNFIDSKKFNDKTKNNYQKNANTYKNEIIFPNVIITEKDNYEIDKIYFEDKIKLKPFIFNESKKVFYGAPIKKSYDIKYQKEENFTDLDLFVAAKEKKVAKKELDKFYVVDKYTIFNGVNFKNPEIGDVKITYEIFSPEYVSFLGKIKNKKLVPYKNFIVVDFVPKRKDTVIKELKIRFIIEITIFITTLYFILYFIITNMRGELKNISLNIIPFINEYCVFGKKNQIILLFISIILLIILKLYIIILIPIIIFYINRQIDHYSI